MVKEQGKDGKITNSIPTANKTNILPTNICL